MSNDNDRQVLEMFLEYLEEVVKEGDPDKIVVVYASDKDDNLPAVTQFSSNGSLFETLGMLEVAKSLLYDNSMGLIETEE